jgi:radical SAM protein with 4Fe4S-binding SPASM domain
MRQMTLQVFKGVLEKIQKHAWRITFYMEGEPMMNPQLFEMIKLSAHDRHIFTSFSTNFTLMREKSLEPLFRSGIDWISVSLDGIRQATYESYRVKGRVEDVLNGIAMIMARRKRNRLRYPYIEVNMIDFYHISAEERNQLENFCAAHGVDQFRVRPEQFGLMGHYEVKTVRETLSKCHWPWISMSIDCDGSVYPCPIAFEQRISYGNLATTSLAEVWNSELYVATRTYLSQKKDLHEGLPKLPCYNCRWYGKIAPVTDAIAIRKQWLQAAQSRSGERETAGQPR